MGFDLQVPLAFPHDVEVVAVLPEEFVFLQSRFVHFLHGTVGVEDGIPVAVESKAARARVPQAPVEFVDGGSTCDGITGRNRRPGDGPRVLHLRFEWSGCDRLEQDVEGVGGVLARPTISGL